MIVRPIPGPHICLRCQLRLVRRPARLPSAYKLQRAFQSTITRPADDQSHDEQKQDRTNLDHSYTKSETGSFKLSFGRKPSKLSEFPLGRLYGFHGHKLREKTESLAIDNLGRPSQVIVLRDHGLTLKDSSKALPLNVGPQDRVDIISLLEQERGLAGHQEVMDNIDGLRSRAEQEIKTWEDVQNFVTELSSGFTVVQLAKYIGSHGISAKQETDGQAAPPPLDGEEASELELDDTEGVAPSEVRQPKVQISRWMPGVSESIEHFDRSLHRGYETPEVFTHKARLAFLLLRDCWSLKIPVVENGLGETEIKLDPQDLEWMIKGKNSPLKRITQTLIQPGEMIESSRSREVIRVTSTQERAELLIPAIKDAIGKIKYVEFGVDELLPNHRGVASTSLRKQLRDSTMCAELSRLTGTQVSPAAKSKLSVSFVDDSQDGFFDRSDIAKQLLLASTNVTDQSSYKLSCVIDEVKLDTPEDSTPGAFLQLDAVESLSWRDRLRTWSRWSSPVRKEIKDGDSEVTSLLVVHDDAIDEQDSTYTVRGKKKKRALFPYVDKQKALNERADPVQLGKAAYWNASRFTSSSAIPGLVLHHGPSTDSFALKPATEALKEKSTYNFLSSIPNTSRILSRSKQIEGDTIQNITMRFKPSPWAVDSKGKPIGFHALRTFPNIEMRFSVRPSTGEMSLKDVLANVSTDISDVMLPLQSLDLRFHQVTTCRMGNPQRLPAIQKFIEMSKMTDGVPQTPSSITLPIANHLCTPTKQDMLSTDESVTNVEYLFVGHEFKNTVVLDFKGWLLLYSSIQGSDNSAARSEIRLRARRSPIFVKRPKKRIRAFRETDEFVDASFNLATALSIGVTGESIVREVKVGAPIRFVANSAGNDIEPIKGYHFLAKRLGTFNVDEGVNVDEAKAATGDGTNEKKYRSLSDVFDFPVESDHTADQSAQQSPRQISDLFDFADELDQEDVMADYEDEDKP